MQNYSFFTIWATVLSFASLVAIAQPPPPINPPGAVERPAYQFFAEDGRPVSYAEVLATAARNDVILWGELHDNPISHWLNYELGHDLFKATLDVGLSFEWLELDQQPVLDSLLAEYFTLDEFPARTRTWPNYGTDYRGLLHLALGHQLACRAANIPRPVARSVARHGLGVLDTLDAALKAQLMPLPLVVDTSLAGYRKMASLMAGHGGSSGAANLVAAQALKDATMAWQIHRFHVPGRRVLHTVGAYHVTDHSGTLAKEDGIPYYLRRFAPELFTLTIVTVEQHHLDALNAEHIGTADFILVVPDSMPGSY